MSLRSVLQVFSTYQKARVTFVQTISELASKPQNAEILQQANVLELLRPLLKDVCPQIRQCAAIALGRLVDADPKAAKNILNDQLLSILLADLDSQNKYFKKSVMFALRSICKHDPALAQAVVQGGGLNAIIYCMGDFEHMVKESALWAAGYIARHNQELAQAVVDSGAVPNIALCLQEPEVSMKQVAACVLSDITKHSTGLAQNVVDCGTVPYLAKAMNNQDAKLKRIILTSLSNIAKHSPDMAECVVEANTFPNTLIHLAHACPRVRKQAACLTRDVAKHSVALTQMIVNLGGIGALLEAAVQDCTNEIKIPCYVALGYIAGHNDQVALTAMSCNAVSILGDTLTESKDDALLAVTVWTLGQIGKHSPEHAKGVASANVFPKLLELYMSDESSRDLQEKTKTTLKQCLQRCMYFEALEPLIYDAPPNILKYILGQCAKILPNDPKARRMFVMAGCLKKIQEIDAEPGSTLMEHIAIVNSCFPDEIVRYYTPGYSEALLDQVENYTPEVMDMLREVRMEAGEMQTEAGIVLDETTSSPSRELKAMN